MTATWPEHGLAGPPRTAQPSTVDGLTPEKRIEIARAYYRQALRDARAEPTPAAWERLQRAVRSLRYALDAAESAARTEARRERARGPRLGG